MRVAILTISDRADRGEYDDETGPAIANLVTTELSADIAKTEIVADEQSVIIELLEEWCDRDVADVIITNGGTGLTKRDVTPEATLAVIERQIPGLAEAMRSAGRAITPLADLSRQVVGQRGRTIIVNLPGSPKGAIEGLCVISVTLAHAVELVRS